MAKWFKSLPDGSLAKEHSQYKTIDSVGVFYGDNISSPNYRSNLIFDWKGYKPPKNGWRYNREAMARLDKKGLLIYPESKEKRIQYKRYLHNTEYWTPSTWFYKDRRAASKKLKGLMGAEVFDFPKDVDVIKRFVETFTKPDDLVMDFFAGSGTTGQSVFEINVSNEKGNRNFILVQLPESLNPKEKKHEEAISLCDRISKPRTISQLTKERLRLSSDQINNDENLNDGVDIGFRSFYLDSSNINKWEPDFDNLSDILDNSIDSVKSERGSEDVLYEILLKYGLDLTYPITEHSIAGKTVYDIAFGSLIVCLDDGITRDVVEGIGKLKQELDSETTRVVFKDAGFEDDNVKTNAIQMLKQYGVDDVKSI